jgi:hypothetical protein
MPSKPPAYRQHCEASLGILRVQSHHFPAPTLLALIQTTKEEWEDRDFVDPDFGDPPSPNIRTALPIYEYMPLPTTRHIRLLPLHPRHPKGPVKCSLIPLLLDYAPRFGAISYTVRPNILPLKPNCNILHGVQVGKPR